FYERQAAWDAEFDAFAEVHKSNITIALNQGRINAFGWRLPRPTITESVIYLDVYSKWETPIWLPIPPDFWLSQKTHWVRSQAEGRDGASSLILVQTDVLLEAFPLPSTDTQIAANKIGDSLVLTAPGEPKTQARRQTGRPSYPWEEFFLEMARR